MFHYKMLGLSLCVIMFQLVSRCVSLCSIFSLSLHYQVVGRAFIHLIIKHVLGFWTIHFSFPWFIYHFPIQVSITSFSLRCGQPLFFCNSPFPMSSPSFGVVTVVVTWRIYHCPLSIFFFFQSRVFDQWAGERREKKKMLMIQLPLTWTIFESDTILLMLSQAPCDEPCNCTGCASNALINDGLRKKPIDIPPS